MPLHDQISDLVIPNSAIRLTLFTHDRIAFCKEKDEEDLETFFLTQLKVVVLSVIDKMRGHRILAGKSRGSINLNISLYSDPRFKVDSIKIYH